MLFFTKMCPYENKSLYIDDMKILPKLIFLLAFLASFTFADTTTVTTPVVDSTKTEISAPKKQAVWIKLEGDVDPAMYEFCARAIGEALEKKPDYIAFEINIIFHTDTP